MSGGGVDHDPAASLRFFGPATQAWFRAAFARPTPVQEQGWARIAAGEHALMLAPTGSGKTLAAFLWALDRLHHQPRGPDDPVGVRVLYVSPMKALVYDVERNLRTPLAGIRAAARNLGLDVPELSVAVRTGDTPQRDRRRFQKDAGDVLVTTPESLYLLLSSRARDRLATVQTVIVDEIHAVAGTKRGVHLALSIERLAELVTRGQDGLSRPAPQRIGLSATQRPLREIAALLGGAASDAQPRPVAIIDCSAAPAADLRIVVPVDDMENPVLPTVEDAAAPPADPAKPAIDAVLDDLPAMAQVAARVPANSSLSGDKQGIWPAIHPQILELIQQHSSTIVFTNSRRMCERLAQRLNELAEEAGLPAPLVRAHHGSVSHVERSEIEELLKAGKLSGIVATSSLELGIDMGAVDLVVMIESPGAVSRGLQRVGRSGHQVGETSIGRIFPKYRGDLLEAAVVVQQMMAAEIEPTRVPTNCLDVLAQHVVSMCLEQDWTVPQVAAVVRAAWPYRGLTEGALVAVLDMLSGRYPGDDFSDLRPRLVWDRTKDSLRARRDARLAVFGNPGTIPDRGLYGVFLAGDAAVDADGKARRGARGRRLGELDEEMVYESRNGDTIILGATTWRIVDIQRDRVLVQPAPGEPGRMPFWRGEGPGRPLGLGRALGSLVREVAQLSDADARQHLVSQCHLDERAASNLLAYLADQREATGTLPTDRAITIERFRDELGDWRVCILTPFGARVHAPWALALEAMLGDPASGSAHTGVQSLWTDDGIVLRFPDAELFDDDGVGSVALPDQASLIPDPDLVEELVTQQLRHSAVFAARFREAATRALLLTRRRPGQRAPLWAQRLAAQRLLAAAGRHPGFPVVLETYRECLQDVFDLPALVDLLRDVAARRIRVDEVETSAPSPFARNLVFSYVAEFLYEGDAPLAERKALALALDRGLLRELLGQEELRDLLDPEVLVQVQAELQGLDPARQARSPDALHDLLRRVGALSLEDLALRCRAAEDGPDGAENARTWLAELQSERRVVLVRIGAEDRWIVVEDVARYRDALGCVPPAGVPSALLERDPAPLQALVRRYARTHVPFTVDQLAADLGLRPALVQPVLDLLAADGSLVTGSLHPGAGPGSADWCDVDVLRRLKRRTLARLRGEVAAVESDALARFQLTWQGVRTDAASRRRGGGAHQLDDAVVQLEGCAIPFSELERRVLPARVPGFRPAQLDELGASGALVWVGRGRLGARDGRIALYRRDQVPLLVPPPTTSDQAADDPDIPWSPVHAAIMGWLDDRGASFTSELQQAVARRLGQALRGDDLTQALWDLVWSGMVTNDTFHPLRSLGGTRRSGGARRRLSGHSRAGASLSAGRDWKAGPRGRLGGGLSGGGGRWSAVAWLVGDGAAPTRRAHARAVMLLDRYGIVGALHARGEELPGGFSAVYDVMRALEESGRVRRGHFVEGLDGAQFALPGAVERLRVCRAQPQPGDDAAATGAGPVVLAVTDPACPWGLALPWPTPGASGSPRRAAGATVVAVDGHAVLFVDSGGRSIITFGALLQPDLARRAVLALKEHLGTRAMKGLRVEKVDGVGALDASAAAALVGAGFSRQPGGLSLDAAI